MKRAHEKKDSTFRKDTLIGEKRISLSQVLSHYNGKLENVEVTFDLMSENKHDSQLCKVGELITVFDGLRINMPNVPSLNINEPLCQTQCMYSDGVANNDTTSNRSILNGGVRARMRLHGTENVASNSLSNGHAVSPTDKSVVFLSGRHAVSLLDGRQISRTDMSTAGTIDGRIGGSAEQFS